MKGAVEESQIGRTTNYITVICCKNALFLQDDTLYTVISFNKYMYPTDILSKYYGDCDLVSHQETEAFSPAGLNDKRGASLALASWQKLCLLQSASY